VFIYCAANREEAIMIPSLKNKVTLITGAAAPGSAGVGVAIAHLFARSGAKLLIAGLPGDPVPELVDQLRRWGARAEPFIGDVAFETQAEACIQTARDIYGRLDVLIHQTLSPLLPIPTRGHRITDFDHTIYSGIRSVFLTTRFALPYLIESKGSILAPGAESSGLGIALNPVHAATQAWVQAFIKGVAAEHAKLGVRANCVAHGPVTNDWTEEFADYDPDTEQAVLSATPLGRRADPAEVANVYAFLASDEASYVTGALYPADGGLSIGSISTDARHIHSEKIRGRNIDSEI
jgi:NAD(P)-dependent dehydrogenase (short-subunit alcohol dehydrogenase family)